MESVCLVKDTTICTVHRILDSDWFIRYVNAYLNAEIMRRVRIWSRRRFDAFYDKVRISFRIRSTTLVVYSFVLISSVWTWPPLSGLVYGTIWCSAFDVRVTFSLKWVEKVRSSSSFWIIARKKKGERWGHGAIDQQAASIQISRCRRRKQMDIRRMTVLSGLRNYRAASTYLFII